MKTNFKVWAAFAAAICCVFAGCNKITVDEPESDYYIVNLGMGGEILNVTDEPLTRGGETADLYGIQVYSTPNIELAEGQNPVWTNYAYGLFASDDDITIKLIKGKKYKFVATMVVDGQNKLYTFSGPSYSNPFYVAGTNSKMGSLTTIFDYQSADYFSGLQSGYSYMADAQSYNHPNTERFYGELVDYVPGKKGSNKALIKMKRVSFGAKFMAKGKLAKEGTLEIQMTGAPKILLDLTTSEKTISDIFTFNDVDGAYADNNHNETIAVTLNWHRDDGTIFPLGTHDITFKRNKTSVVQITIENENADNPLGVEIDDVDMTEDEDITNIEDGEVTDTDVDTNA